MWILAFLILGLNEDTGIKSELVLSPVSEDSDFFLQGPRDLAIDDQGRFHVLDLVAKTVFVWDKNGEYQTGYGAPGEGPGEFNFAPPAGGRQGYINIVDGTIYIYDGGARTLNTFDKDLKFIKSTSFQIEGGRVETFRVLSPKKNLVFYSSYFSDTPFRRIATYKGPGEIMHEYRKEKDDTWRYTQENGQRRVTLHIYYPALVMGYNDANGEIMIGHSSKSEFDVFDAKGSLIRRVPLAMKRLDVTDKDISEWNDTNWFKNQTFFKADFADRMPYYDRIIPVGDKGYLVILDSPDLSRCRGQLVDKQGKKIRDFKTVLGNGGGFMV